MAAYGWCGLPYDGGNLGTNLRGHTSTDSVDDRPNIALHVDESCDVNRQATPLTVTKTIPTPKKEGLLSTNLLISNFRKRLPSLSHMPAFLITTLIAVLYLSKYKL